MSKHKDYTRYSNREQRTETKLMEEVETQVANTEFEVPTTEPEVEQLAMDEVVADSAVEDVTQVGVVVGCSKLNIRKEPSIKAEVIGQIPLNSKIVVYSDEVYQDFYRICTYSGVEGYCMKKFINL